MWSSWCSPQWTGPSLRTLKPPLLLALEGRLLGVAAGDTEPRLGGWGYDDDVAGASERKAPDVRFAVSWLPWAVFWLPRLLLWLVTVGEDIALVRAALMGLLERRWERFAVQDGRWFAETATLSCMAIFCQQEQVKVKSEGRRCSGYEIETRRPFYACQQSATDFRVTPTGI